jgi:eukaryotic-like serine/threonine-protein kinase
MKLVESALKTPPEEREAYLRRACAGNPELFAETWTYVLWEQRMNGFLLEPVYSRLDGEHPFAPGALLDSRFRVIREVAQGGMGVVYEAVDQKLERRIALKCAKRGFGKRLPPEVRNASEISHPNVCKIFEIHTTSTEHGDIDFLTMEFLEGETLTERLSRGRLTDKEVRSIAEQLCAGLAEAHRNHVIHGDLKSNNVLLTTAPDGRTRAVITDFGLARKPEVSQGTRQSGNLVGTPDYMAPELWEGQKASVASDIYALGVILYELIAGKRPELYTEDHLPVKPSPVHPKWDRILQRCLDPNPAKRHACVDDLLKALQPPNTRRWFLASAAAGALALVSGLVTYQTATAPPETIRLAVLPFTSIRENPFLAEVLSRDIDSEVARVKGNGRTQMTVVPLNRAMSGNVETVEKAGSVLGATHVLHGTLKDEKGKLILQAFLTDTRTGVSTKEWKAEYLPGETRYVPVALAGMVTGTFRLPALHAKATVNATAWQDYVDGIAAMRRDSGVDAALASLERAVAADSDSPLTYAALGEAQWIKYNLSRDPLWFDKATDSIRQAEKRNPDLAPVRCVSGIMLQHSGLYELAVTEYLRAIELDPKSGEPHRRLGRVYQISNRVDEALVAYRRAAELDPQNGRNHQALGNYYFERANYGLAIQHWKKMVELNPGEPEAHIVLGAAYMNAGQFAAAESELRTSLGLEEKPKALHTLALVLMYQQKYAEAIPYLLRAVALWPDRHRVWTHLAYCYRRTNSGFESEKAYRHALDLADKEVTLRPRDGTTRSGLAYLCANLGDRRRAVSEIAQALNFSPNDADTRWWAVLTYEVLNQRDSTLSLLTSSSDELIADLSRWPEVADLHKDSRFKDLLQRHQTIN